MQGSDRDAGPVTELSAELSPGLEPSRLSRTATVCSPDRAIGGVLVAPTAARAATSVSVPVGTNPDAVAVDSTTGTAYVANTGDNTVSVIRDTTSAGAATVTFAQGVDSPVGPNPAAVAIGDLNGDGKLDVVAGNTGDSTISVLFAQ